MQYSFNKRLESLLPSRHLKILVALSGGMDSVCLAELLLRSGMDMEIAAAHMNFHLRGEESNGDETMVAEWAEQRGVKLFCKSVDTFEYAKRHSLSIEMAARELRYEWFYTLKEEYGFDYIALAHHANDNVETLLLNLLRGTGLKGICGMKEIDNNRGLLRPLLSYTRDQIDKFVRKNSIPYRVDSTNSDVKYHRNRIRCRVIPELEIINPSAVRQISRDMGYFTQASTLLSGLVEEKMLELVKRGEEAFGYLDNLKMSSRLKRYSICRYGKLLEASISLEQLAGVGNVAYWLYEILGEYNFNSRQIEEMVLSLDDKKTISLESCSYIAVKERGYIKIAKKGVTAPALAATVALTAEDALFDAGNISIKISVSPVEEYNQSGIDSPTTLYLDGDEFDSPLVLRGVSKGELWQPLGMKGKKKVSDYLTDIKLDMLLKSGLVVLATNRGSEADAGAGGKGEILCLPGIAISERYKVKKSTKRLLKVEITPKTER